MFSWVIFGMLVVCSYQQCEDTALVGAGVSLGSNGNDDLLVVGVSSASSGVASAPVPANEQIRIRNPNNAEADLVINCGDYPQMTSSTCRVFGFGDIQVVGDILHPVRYPHEQEFRSSTFLPLLPLCSTLPSNMYLLKLVL